MSDELDKHALPGSDEGESEDEDVEAHKSAIGKTAVGKTSVGETDEDDVEAHKFAIGKNAIGASDDDEKTSIG